MTDHNIPIGDDSDEATVVEVEEISTKERSVPVYEILSPSKYVGKVVDVHGGYCFIGNVRRGFESINTGGDVFCPFADLKRGDMVEFENIQPNPEKAGQYKTVGHVQVIGTFDLMKVAKSDLVKTIAKMTEPTEAHVNRKYVDPELVKQALN
ncbi:MAG: hypothetical protein NUV82_02070, partial [Candidatus Komeilibacteria bacterium]|nr:hypothetical protein [Candidatus Komeilibacteria bacterium]